ncbi:MAG: acyl-CoA desaturase [Acidimicrobiia bacterium]|nr:acyl-CoA desaturase [Acidimicrobiia bacterium]
MSPRRAQGPARPIGVPRRAIILPSINWTFVAALVLAHVGAAYAVHRLAVGRVAAPTVALAAVWYLAAGFSITAGYHRLFAHRAYCAVRPLRIAFLVFGASAWQNSVLTWVADHRAHHRHTDRFGDPHAITDGFWHAHALWLLRPGASSSEASRMVDLTADPDVRLQDRIYVPLAVLTGLVAPTLIAWTWHDPINGLLVAGFLRTTLGLQATFCVNSVAHRFGSQPGATSGKRRASARNNRFVSLVALGEGYHFFHHAYPRDYRAGFRRRDLDPTKWLIWCLSTLNLASDLGRRGPVAPLSSEPCGGQLSRSRGGDVGRPSKSVHWWRS